MKYIIISIIITAFILQSCSDDFLNTPPRAAESEASFYETFENLESATIGCYSMLSAQGNYDLGHMMILGSTAGDDMEAGGRDPAEIPGIQDCDRMLHTPDNVRIGKVWGYTYKGVYFCNMFLKYFPAMVDGEGLTQAENDLLKIRIGEVKFLRAMYYHILVQAFGGVVLLSEPAKLEDFELAERARIKEIFELMETDLREAMAILPERSRVSDVGRATRGAAQALLGKVLLYESSYAKYKVGQPEDIDDRYVGCTERWGEALTELQGVITSGEYSLAGLDGTTYSTFWTNDQPTTDAYRWIFCVEGDNQPGSIFEIQSIMDLNAGWIQSRGNGLTSWCTVRWVFNPADGVAYGHGWGWLTPKADLLALFEPDDPRIKTTFGGVNDSALHPTYGWSMLDVSYTTTGYCMRKYEASPDQYWGVNGGDWNRGPINEKLIRLADVYLMAAEAAFESGDPGTALTYLNLVRERADMCDGSLDGVPSQLAAVTLQNIRDERRFELTGEGHRFFDLVRWGISEEVLDGSTLVAGAITVHYMSPKHDFFPIPQEEIDVVGGSLKQYEGW